MAALVPDTVPRRAYTVDGRLGALIVRGGRLTRDVVDAVTSGSLSYSTDAVTQLTLTVHDPDLRLLASDLFTPGTTTTAGSRVDYGRLRLEVAAVELGDDSGTPVLTVTARSRGAQKLRRARGARVRHKMSPTEWAALEAKAAGLRFVGQPSSDRRSIGRRKGETSWDALGRLAEELGYVCFEAAGVLYFGRPTWLADRATDRLRIAWEGASSDPRIVTIPRCRRTADDGSKAATVEVDLAGSLGDTVTPGHRFTLDGIPTFEGRYLIDAVTIPLADDAPVTVSASTPVNPVPQPPDPPGGSGGGTATGAVSSPPVGRLTVKHVKADREQLANATTIYRVGRSMGIGAQGIRIAIATAIQESVLRNLPGGDRDSVGLFQQRATWGSFATRHDPAAAARLFYNALKRVRGWESLTLAAAAQAVQRSGHPTAYAQWASEASALVDAIAATATRVRSSSGSSTSRGDGGRATGGHSAGAFVAVALRQAGDRYVWAAEASPSDPDPDAFDCSELVQWAAARVGVRFVDGSSAQIAACRSISVAQAIRTRGALLHHPGHIAISLGNGRTIEAANSRVGVVSYSAAGRFTRGGLIPGIAY